MQPRRWAAAGAVPGWPGLAVAAVVVTPVRGRSATGWLLAVTGLRRRCPDRVDPVPVPRRTRRSRGPGRGRTCPGSWPAFEIHDGPPAGPDQRRVAIIQNHAAAPGRSPRRSIHPGHRAERARPAGPVRRRAGRAARRWPPAPSWSTRSSSWCAPSPRTAPNATSGSPGTADPAPPPWPGRQRRPAGDPDRGRRCAPRRSSPSSSPRPGSAGTPRSPAAASTAAPGSCTALTGEVEAHLRGGLGMTERGLADLPRARRWPAAPGSRPATGPGSSTPWPPPATDPGVNADVPWAMAGPSGADPAVRHYSHDAWNSISATIKLPVKGAVMGALAPVLTPTEPGERRSFMVAYPIVRRSRREPAERQQRVGRRHGRRAARQGQGQAARPLPPTRPTRSAAWTASSPAATP